MTDKADNNGIYVQSGNSRAKTAPGAISISEISQLTGVSPDPDKDLKERLSDTEMRVFRIISEHGEMSADEVGIAAGQRPGYVNPILSALEIKGFITSEAGKFFLANQIDTSYNRKM
jgi:hypothetical protein